MKTLESKADSHGQTARWTFARKVLKILTYVALAGIALIAISVAYHLIFQGHNPPKSATTAGPSAIFADNSSDPPFLIFHALARIGKILFTLGIIRFADAGALWALKRPLGYSMYLAAILFIFGSFIMMLDSLSCGCY